jgi:SNF2 family DNA or RNA helicase
MIAKGAVRAFLGRDLDDWHCVKSMTEEEVWEELDEELPEDFRFETTPWKHQAASFICGLHNKDFLFLLDMGLGKSKTVVDILAMYENMRELAGRTLILAPNEVGISSWEDQIKEHSTLPYTSLLGTQEEKWVLLETTNTPFYIISYDGLVAMLTSLVKAGKSSKKKKQRKLVKKLVDKFVVLFQGLVLDEIHLCKNQETLNWKLCNKIAANADFRYGLTGTPFGRNPIDLWAQFYLIDRGETLGATLTFFREIFFRKVANGFGYDWVFDSSLEGKLHELMRNKSIRYSEEELDSMPPKVYITRKVFFSSEAYTYYSQAKAGLVEARGDYTMLKNAFIRLRQIASGYIDFKDEEENRERIIFKENPRLDDAMNYIASTPVKDKVVVFVEFTPSGDMIEERLKKAKIKYERLYSGTKDKTAAKNNFINDPECKVLLANSKSGGVNLNLQVADHEYFYECPVSPITRAQAEKRAPRGGKKKTTFIADVIVVNSVDEDVAEFIREGKNLFDALVEGKGSVR